MEKEYVEALLKDIDKSTSLEEKTHLITVFISELSKSDAENKKSITNIHETLKLSSKAAEAFSSTLPATQEKFSQIDELMLSMSRAITSTTESMTNRTNDVVEIFDLLTKVNKNIIRLMDRIEKLEDR